MVSRRPRASVSLSLTALSVACAGSPGSVPDPPSASPPAALDPPTALSQGAYTQAQSERGAEVFEDTCRECHDLWEVRGADFMFTWEGSSVGRLFNTISRTMPEDDPGSLDTGRYLAVVAYILELNGFPAGGMELGSDLAAMFQLRIER